MKDVNERIAALPPEQRALLVQRLKQKGNVSVSQVLATPSHNEWVVRYRQNDQAHLRLFCFHYAGGGASIFYPWVKLLQDMLDVEVCCIQLPGRESRVQTPAYTRIEPMEEALAEAILPYLDKPFVFFGHSMGSLVCFELARLLRRKHNKYPMHIFLGAFRAPQLPNPNIKIYHLPSEVFKVVLRSDGIDDKVLQNDELMQAMLPTLRADYELCDTYVYKEEAPLDCPFSLFGGLDDVRVRQEDLALWSNHTTQECSLTMVPGSHIFLQSAQDQLLSAISHVLQALLAKKEQAHTEECHA